MDEPNVLKSTSFLLFEAEVLQLFWDLRWLVSLSIALVVIDLWFGIKASICRGEQIRKSRAGRRTMSKIIDYMCYLILGGFIGQAIGEPLGVDREIVAAICMGLACLFEIDSVIHNIFECKKVKVSFSVRYFVFSVLKNKYKIVSDALEKSIKIKKDENK